MATAHTETGPPTDERVSKGVFWRAPSTLQRRVRDSASKLTISQNAYLTTAAIFGELVLTRRPDGKPKNLLRLIERMNATVKKNDVIVMDACPKADWADVEDFIAVLQDANIVSGIHFEDRDEIAPNMLVYAFAITREGCDIWLRLGDVVHNVIAAEEYAKGKAEVEAAATASAA